MSAVNAGTTVRPRWRWLVAVCMGAGVVLVFWLPFPHEVEERALCDRAVSELLTSKDLVEVTRAGIIVDRLNCRIGSHH